MEHIIFSVLLVAFFVVTDLLPLLKGADHEKKAAVFSVAVYAAALLINILIGLGVKIETDPSVAAFLDSLIKTGK